MATKIVAELAEPQATVLVEAVAAARYMVNASGDKTDVVLPLPVWEKLLEWLEDVEDRVLVQAWLPKLKQGPKASGALKWDDVADVWDDDQSV
ncbi:MAG: hypothetical protein DYG89_41525 [Caldilinea sp. CFX5]|nr:hypothetical protein [Caldilinea sp. CFX5]